MNLPCSSCSTVYRIDPAKVPPAGVRARCTVCSNVITVSPGGAVESAPVPPPAAAPAPEQAEHRPSAAEIAVGLGDAFVPPSEPAHPPAEPQAAPAPQPVPVLDKTPVLGVPIAAPPAQPIVPKTPSAPVPTATPVLGTPIVQPPAAPPAPADGGIRLSRPFSGGGGPGAAASPATPVRPTAPVFRPEPGQPVRPTAPVPPPVQQAPPAQLVPPPGAPAQQVPPAAPPVAPPTPPAQPAAPEGSVTQGFKRKPINPFLSRDPTQKARRLARALISDMIVYQPDKRQKALQEGNLKEVFGEEVKKSWEEYVQQVGEEIANSTPFFRDALNEILAGGQAVF